MTTTQAADVVDKVVEILSQVRHKPDHHLGRPFLTAYQIAIRLNQRYPDLAESLGHRDFIGGKNSGSYTSLTQAVAATLSRTVRDNLDPRLEGAFLSNDLERELRWRNPRGDDVVSSLTGEEDDLSMFRLRT
jgi:hypothetical protein